MSRKGALTIELPKCPECGQVSRALASSTYGGKFFCTGPRGELHRRTQMRPVKFREVAS